MIIERRHPILYDYLLEAGYILPGGALREDIGPEHRTAALAVCAFYEALIEDSEPGPEQRYIDHVAWRLLNQLNDRKE